MYTTLAFFALIAAGSASVLPMEHAYKEGKTLRLPINKNDTEALFDKWVNQALSGLMAAVTAGRIEQMDTDEQEELKHCSKSAYTVPDHAHCVVKVLDKTRHIKRPPKVIPKYQKNTKKRSHKSKSTSHLNRQHSYKPVSHLKRKPIKRKDDWVGSFRLARAKRSIEVVNRASYNLPSADTDSFVSNVIRQTARTIRRFKNKDNETQSWRSVVRHVKTMGRAARKMKKHRKALKQRLRQMIDNTPDSFQDPMRTMKVNEMEMEDEEIANKRKKATEENELFQVPISIFREAVKLAMAANGKNVSNFDSKTIRVVSPRFLSIVPEQNPDEVINMLSPSLFSIHGEGSDAEKTMSLQNLVKALPNKDQEAWLDFIVEAAGVTDFIDKTEKEKEEQRRKEVSAADGTPLYFTKKNVTKIFGEDEKRKIETFEELDRMYTDSQKEDLDRRGYSFLTPEQLDLVYGPKSPFNDTVLHKKFLKLRRLHDEADPHHLIEKDIRALAEAKKFGSERRKQIITEVFPPGVQTPFTKPGDPIFVLEALSPLLLTSIVASPTILGAVVLSPWTFVPLVLAPRVIAPVILSPINFDPVILSPLVMHPFILSPGVFNPIVLSPLVLSPFILSPQVLSPIILSPLVLNPSVYSPKAVTTWLLSPYVLTPPICSPSLLYALILSPFALSPLVHTKLISTAVILSPSWLS
ncbi:hypothetical protein V3C99_013575 [Haemonchus contortus]